MRSTRSSHGRILFTGSTITRGVAESTAATFEIEVVVDLPPGPAKVTAVFQHHGHPWGSASFYPKVTEHTGAAVRAPAAAKPTARNPRNEWCPGGPARRKRGVAANTTRDRVVEPSRPAGGAGSSKFTRAGQAKAGSIASTTAIATAAIRMTIMAGMFNCNTRAVIRDTIV